MKKINAVAVGAGVQGMVHVQAAVESPYIDKVYVCDPDESRIAEARKLYGEKILPVSYEDALKDPSIRFASISSPNHHHIRQAGDFMRQGKAVLLEKPMGASLEEARKILSNVSLEDFDHSRFYRQGSTDHCLWNQRVAVCSEWQQTENRPSG